MVKIDLTNKKELIDAIERLEKLRIKVYNDSFIKKIDDRIKTYELFLEDIETEWINEKVEQMKADYGLGGYN